MTQDRLDPEIIRREIEWLRVSHPDIAADEEQWLLALESETDLHEQLAKIVRYMLEAQALAGGIDLMLRDIKDRRERFERRSDAMRALAFKLMQWAEVKKVELPQATLSIRNGTPRVIITDETRLPEHCFRIKREPDKQIIRDIIDQGEALAGAELSNAEPVLAVRTK